MMGAHAGLGHHDLVHKITRAFVGISDFSAGSSLFVQAAFFRFSWLRTMVHGTFFFFGIGF